MRLKRPRRSQPRVPQATSGETGLDPTLLREVVAFHFNVSAVILAHNAEQDDHDLHFTCDPNLAVNCARDGRVHLARSCCREAASYK